MRGEFISVNTSYEAGDKTSKPTEVTVHRFQVFGPVRDIGNPDLISCAQAFKGNHINIYTFKASRHDFIRPRIKKALCDL